MDSNEKIKLMVFSLFQLMVLGYFFSVVTVVVPIGYTHVRIGEKGSLFLNYFELRNVSWFQFI